MATRQGSSFAHAWGDHPSYSHIVLDVTAATLQPRVSPCASHANGILGWADVAGSHLTDAPKMRSRPDVWFPVGAADANTAQVFR